MPTESSSSDKPRDPASTPVTGAAIGAAVGTAAVVTAVPVIQAVGFTAGGIAAGSFAAGAMSSAAGAAGGAISSGSAAAVAQSIGALGVVPIAIAAPVVAATVGVGVAIPAIVKCFRSGQHEYQTAYERCDKSQRCWIIATEEGWGNVRVCRYYSEREAHEAFEKIWCGRILYNPDRQEIKAAGGPWAHGTIRRVMNQNYFD